MKDIRGFVPVFALGVILGIEIRKTFTERLPFIAAAQAGIKSWATKGLPVVWFSEVDEEEETVEGDDDD
jgi:hypothetical protein